MTDVNQTQQPVRTDAQKPNVGEYVELFTLDTTTIPGQSTILNFTSTQFADSTVVFNRISYTPIDIKSEGWETTTGGGFPTPRMTLSVSGGIDEVSTFAAILKGLVINLDGLVGATITRTRTLKKYLDGEATADPNAHFPLDVYRVDMMTQFNKQLVEWELKAALDQEGQKLPRRQIIRSTCSHTYRIHDPTNPDADINGFVQGSCPYTGTAFFKRDGTSTVDAAEDSCGKRVSDCQLRFGAKAVLPYQGFVGVGKGRV